MLYISYIDICYACMSFLIILYHVSRIKTLSLFSFEITLSHHLSCPVHWRGFVPPCGSHAIIKPFLYLKSCIPCIPFEQINFDIVTEHVKLISCGGRLSRVGTCTRLTIMDVMQEAIYQPTYGHNFYAEEFYLALRLLLKHLFL